MEDSDSFELFVADLSARFTGLPIERVDGEITSALEQLLEVFGTDRSTLFEVVDDGKDLHPTHSAAVPGLKTYPEDSSELVPSWYAARLSRGKPIVMSQLPDDLPAEAGSERAYVVRRGMKSHLAVPLVVGGHYVLVLATAAFSAFRNWSETDERQLRIIGQILVNAFYRARIEGELRDSLAEVRELKARIEEENVFLRLELGEFANPQEIVGDSPSLRRAVSLLTQVAPTDTTVLLRGETGTGKELFADAIRTRSLRADGPIIKVNCSAIPTTLIESELFGHERGAFTGAVNARPGRFELAEGGTLFLDEIGDLPGEVQAKLLRVLQDREVQRLGATRARAFDVRIVTATNRDLEKAVAEGSFRQDLYYRISVFVITIPPLRDRREDIPILVWSIINRRQEELGRSIEKIPKRVMDALQSYSWPGNIRELENVIERALILSSGKVLELDDAVIAGHGVSGRTGHETELLDQVAGDHITAVLERCNWRISGRGNAAEVLGLHPNTLRSRMKKLAIVRPDRKLE